MDSCDSTGRSSICGSRQKMIWRNWPWISDKNPDRTIALFTLEMRCVFPVIVRVSSVLLLQENDVRRQKQWTRN